MKKRKSNSPHHFNAILLSGLAGSGKSTVARELSRQLKWSIFSIGAFFREQWKEKHPHADVSFESFMKKMTLKAHRDIDIQARKAFERGHVIGEMHHGVAITKGLPVLEVFISAPLAVRAERAIQTGRFPGKSNKQIMKLLSQREAVIVDVSKKIYGKAYNYEDTGAYHITLNSALLSVEEIANTLLSFFT